MIYELTYNYTKNEQSLIWLLVIIDLPQGKNLPTLQHSVCFLRNYPFECCG